MKIINLILSAAVVVAFQACDLDLNPHTSYNENNVNVKNDSESQYSTRTDMLGLRNSLYNSWVKDIQEKGYMDWLITTETRSDNAARPPAPLSPSRPTIRIRPIPMSPATGTGTSSR